MTDTEVERAVAAAIAETGAASIRDMGKVMAHAQGAPHRPDGLRPRRRDDQAGVPLAGLAARGPLVAEIAQKRGGSHEEAPVRPGRDRPRRGRGRCSRARDAAVSILSFGCVIRDWRVDGPRGSLPMVLGFPRLEDYLHHSRSHGAIVGRVANRTGGRRLHPRRRDLRADRRTTAPNHLHGGATGLGRRIWDMETDSAANTLYLFYRSPDGEEGYPGDGRLQRRLPPRGAAAHLRDGGRARPADPDQPRQPQLLQPRRRAAR